MGVVTIAAPEENGLLGLVSLLAPVIAGGNTCLILASEKKPFCAITLAEVLNSSDLPGGVVNILTGYRSELLPHLANHLDVNAMAFGGGETNEWKQLNELASLNVKRMKKYELKNTLTSEIQSPYMILDFQEIKTTWHPIELTGGAKAGY
jgi:acyl-CoA reductase-like NAD-dependent aldehyde dehydrogenase